MRDMSDPTIEELEIGTVLGDRHRVGSRLGAGGMAVTYEATHVKTGAEVAIKVMNRAAVNDPELQARFMREAEVMGRLSDSANIVSVYDIGTHVDGRGYIVMEFVRGVNLQTELHDLRNLREAGSSGGEISIERLCKIALDVARGLRDAHAAGVIHRDVKPANVMLARTRDHGEIAKLVDFGISADLGKKGIERTLTRAGVSIGTPEYMSPEQSLGLAAAASFDVFALGVLMYEMATGKLPPPVIELSKGLPELGTFTSVPALDELVRGCLEPNPDDRVQSAQEVAQRLEQILADRAASAKRPAAVKSMSWPLLGVAAVVGAVGIIGGVALAWNYGAFDRAVIEDPNPADVAVSAAAAHATAPETAHDDGAAVEVASTSMVREDTGHDSVDEAEDDTGEDDDAADDAEVAPPATTTDEAAVTPAPKSAVEPKPKPKPSPDQDAAACAALRGEAQRAKTNARWRDVLRATTEKSCWPDKAERQKLRVEALLELKDYARCASEGAGAGDSAVSSMVKFCNRNLQGSEGSR
jgi:tRNA A-37 threonylcarbamoyl transferase component Bud32